MHATLSDALSDLVINALSAARSSVDIEIYESGSVLKFKVADDGTGCDSERVLSPFVTGGLHPERKVGLGLAFLAMEASALDISGRDGCKVAVEFDLRDVDTPPTGDLVQGAALAFCFEKSLSVRVERTLKTPKGEGCWIVEGTTSMDAGMMGRIGRRMRAGESELSGFAVSRNPDLNR